LYLIITNEVEEERQLKYTVVESVRYASLTQPRGVEIIFVVVVILVVAIPDKAAQYCSPGVCLHLVKITLVVCCRTSKQLVVLIQI